MNSYKTHKFGPLTLLEDVTEIPHQCACDVFAKLRKHSSQNFLLESKDISHIYGRLSLIGINPIIKIKGKDNKFSIEILEERGRKYLDQIKDQLNSVSDKCVFEENLISGEINLERDRLVEETERTKQKNVTRIIRAFLTTFKSEKKSFLGLYGAFAYDMVRLFEEIPENLPPNDIPDFTVSLFDTFVHFDHLKERAKIVMFRSLDDNLDQDKQNLLKVLKKKNVNDDGFSITDAKFNLEKKDYEKNVDIARDLARRGELFEVVLSNELNAEFGGDPFSLYLKYRDINPSPYLFFFDFGDEQLVGASPEMMVRCEEGLVHLRPISGTAPRGKDPIEDHENMLELLTSAKERAELDMLIDLGRNDLARICEPGIKVSDYRFVEKYSRVMHTVAHLTGTLRKDFLAFDAFVACINAGTLTGAPKVAAMIEIEKHEKTRRGYYGGNVGYLTFSGDMDTGIIIRTAHIKNGRLNFRVGATLLYDSVPEKEYDETIAKAKAFMNTFMI